MLAYTNMAIDVFQSGKLSFLKTFVQDESVRKPLEDFVDEQSVFAKQIAKTSWETTGAITKAFVNTIFKGD